MTPAIQGTQQILSGEIQEPQYPQRNVDKKHLQHPRLRNPSIPRPRDAMSWKKNNYVYSMKDVGSLKDQSPTEHLA